MTTHDPNTCRDIVAGTWREFPDMPDASLARAIANQCGFVEVEPLPYTLVMDGNHAIRVPRTEQDMDAERQENEAYNACLVAYGQQRIRAEICLQRDNSNNMSLAGCAPTAEFMANSLSGPASKAKLGKDDPLHWTTVAMVVALLAVIGALVFDALRGMP